jgi:hypothetical protein
LEQVSASRAPAPQAVLQHTASTQKPVAHWLAVVHDCPCVNSGLSTFPTSSLESTCELHPIKQAPSATSAAIQIRTIMTPLTMRIL